MMEAICGANCSACDFFKKNKCNGCMKTNGCPFGKKCWIAEYINVGGKDSFEELKKELIDEINDLCIDGMPKLDELYALGGKFVNLEYPLPNGKKAKFLADDEIYLGNQVECEFNDGEIAKCFGIISNMSFILICEYEEDGNNPEILYFKKR